MGHVVDSKEVSNPPHSVATRRSLYSSVSTSLWWGWRRERGEGVNWRGFIAARGRHAPAVSRSVWRGSANMNVSEQRCETHITKKKCLACESLGCRNTYKGVCVHCKELQLRHSMAL